MADVSKDVATVADQAGPGLSLAHAAETMRMAVIDAQLGADLGPGDKARMLYALYALYGVRQAAEAQDALAPMLAATPGFQSLPPKQVWRMLLDRSAWGDGRHAGLRFENEPGYLGGMYNGLSRTLQAHQQGHKFDASMLEHLHDAATEGVYPTTVLWNLRDEKPDFRSAVKCTRPADAAVPQHARGDPAERVRCIEAGFKHGAGGGFGLKAGANVTRAGLDDFFANQDLHLEDQRSTMFTVNEREELSRLRAPSGWDGKSRLLLMSLPLSRDENKAKVDAIIAHYRQALPQAATEDAKLAEIARCVQRLEQAHPFIDGNARTTGFLVLNKLLLETGFSPAMIADPNRFDAYSINELVQEIRQGQKTFAEHCGAQA